MDILEDLRIIAALLDERAGETGCKECAADLRRLSAVAKDAFKEIQRLRRAILAPSRVARSP